MAMFESRSLVWLPNLLDRLATLAANSQSRFSKQMTMRMTQGVVGTSELGVWLVSAARGTRSGAAVLGYHHSPPQYSLVSTHSPSRHLERKQRISKLLSGIYLNRICRNEPAVQGHAGITSIQDIWSRRRDSQTTGRSQCVSTFACSALSSKELNGAEQAACVCC